MALSREELEKQMEEYGQQGGTKPAADGFIYYKFGSPSKETGGPENTDQALGAESSTVAQKLEAEPSDAELGFLDKPLLRKYKTHGDHARAFHDHPERLINDIQLACPFNLEKTACPLGEKCTLVPVCMVRAPL